jgi:hypothetical protein
MLRKALGNIQMAHASPASDPSFDELFEFERLLFDLSVRFANVPADRVVDEIERALMQLVKFLGFDRSEQNFLCSVAVEGVEPPARGPIPAELTWFAKELRAGRTVVIR